MFLSVVQCKEGEKRMFSPTFVRTPAAATRRHGQNNRMIFILKGTDSEYKTRLSRSCAGRGYIS